jgi:hypothetical protein
MRPVAHAARFLRAAVRPRWTLRVRLTLLYGGTFLVCGAALLAVTYALVSHGITGGEGVALHGPAGGGFKSSGGGAIRSPPPSLTMPNAPPAVIRILEHLRHDPPMSLDPTMRGVQPDSRDSPP